MMATSLYKQQIHASELTQIKKQVHKMIVMQTLYFKKLLKCFTNWVDTSWGYMYNCKEGKLSHTQKILSKENTFKSLFHLQSH